MQQLIVGNPAILKTDIGPVIDDEAKQTIGPAHPENEIEGLSGTSIDVWCNKPNRISKGNFFVVPTAIELPNLDDLQREVFGPVFTHHYL